MASQDHALLGFDPAARLNVGGVDELAEVGVTLSRARGLVVTIEHDDGTITTVVLPAERVNWDHVVESGRAAA